MNMNHTLTDIFNMYDYNITIDTDSMNNRLFATFTQQSDLDDLIKTLSSTYSIMYNKRSEEHTSELQSH